MRSPRTKRLLALSVLAGVALAAAIPAAAQYYGRNKVQYQKFDFRVMKTRHFDIYFYLVDENTVKTAAQMAERWYARFARMFNHELRGRQPLILYASGPEFQQTTVISGPLGEGTGGVTESFKRRIILPYGATLAETDHVIGHELVHAFQYDLMAQGHSDAARGNDASLRIPLWFIEGMAEYLSIGPYDPQTAMWMRDAVARKKLPDIKKMDNSAKYFPYRYGHAFWAFLTGRYGDEVVGKLMKAIGRAGSYEAVLEGLLRVKMDALNKDWHKAMDDAYLPLAPPPETKAAAAAPAPAPTPRTEALTQVGQPVIKATEEGFYNISPAVSHDGKRLVFLSSRDLFSIDYFLADAATGKIIRRLTSTAVDPHFESIEFIRSAGSWDGEGRRFVFGAVAKGRPQLTILDVDKDRIDREVPFPELAEILNPSFSPDGKAVAFSAVSGGVSDLFVYDLVNNVLKQVTRDEFGDIEPAWSPDGTKIAFVTERFSANLDWEEVRNYDLAVLDVASGQITRLPGFPNGNNTNPAWAPDSASLFFVSDQNGKSDLYRIALAGGRITQVTNLYTGIGGITEISPAISVAAATGRLMFSGYDEGRFSIFRMDDPKVLEGVAYLAQSGRNPGLLPPRSQPEGALLGLLKNPMFGLPKDTNYQVTPYRPKLSLDFVTQPQVAVGVDRYGTYGGGGIAAYWSDMLGYESLVTMAQTSNRLIDTSGLVAYINSRNRLNWGAAAQRFSYPYGYYTVQPGEFAGQPVLYEIEDIYRQINYDLSAFSYYPFSQVQRAEFTLGGRYLQFNHTVYTNIYSYPDQFLIVRDKQSIPVAPGLWMGYGNAALVYDSGIFGATSPILGQSYLVSASPTVGTINYTTAMADIRKYLMPVRPFTLAFRVLHYGRYGSGSEDQRLYPVYIGYWDMVRGYESFTNDEFADPSSAFDVGRLYGSRLLMGNVELRFPLLGVLGLGRGFYGAWPLEAYAFYDVGLAWWGKSSYTDNPYITNPSEDPRAGFLGGGRKPISSVGVGVRTNLFGYLVIGIHYVNPISRPARGWHWQLSISPGF